MTARRRSSYDKRKGLKARIRQMARSLKAARVALFASLDDGVFCPCCDQYAKRYRRKLNSGMAATLVWMVRTYLGEDDEWVEIAASAPRFTLRAKDFSVMEHWDLIQHKPHDGDSSKRSSGFWRPTDRGIAFARGRIRVPSHVYLYNGESQGFDNSASVSIKKALGSNFNYRELMDGDFGE